MSSKVSPIATTAFPKTFDERIKIYTVAAAATGVSILALGQASNAEVLVTRRTIPLTPVANVPISVSVDLNRDGIPDFSFSIDNYFVESRSVRISISPLQGGAVLGAPAERAPFYASALVRGAKIGPSARFSSKGFAEVEKSFLPYTPSQYVRNLYGDWGGNQANRYLGVKFLIKGQTHYGWVRLSVNSASYPMSATITGYAYETIPNKPIVAGVAPASSGDVAQAKIQPSGDPSLGMLAVGAAGLTAWRRRE